jgi:alcohol dehydrogenase (cytochrome c)
LRVLWSYQVNSLQKVETTPLVVDGIMYLTEPPSNVTAIDARTGRTLWKYRRPLANDMRVCCGQVNRGVRDSGKSRVCGYDRRPPGRAQRKDRSRCLDITVAEYKDGYSITGAPLVVKDKVVVGMAGGEYGVRGFLDAYEASTGKRAWRFYTIPTPDEPGGKSWAGESWKTGSATTWVTGTYDPDTNLVYWALAIRVPTGMAMFAPATISTPIACWRWMPIQAS